MRGSPSAGERMRVQDMTTCAQCLKDYEADDILWATPTGELEGDTRPVTAWIKEYKSYHDRRYGKRVKV